MELTKVSVVIPVLDEEATIDSVVKELILSPIVKEIIVSIDPKTTDSSAVKAEEAGAIIVHSPKSGFGATLKNGFRQAKQKWIFRVDGDLTQVDHRWIERAADVVTGSTVLVKTYWPRSKKPRMVTELSVKPLLKLLCPDLDKINLPISGIYLFDSSSISIDSLTDDWALDLDILIKCYLNGFEIRQVMIPEIIDRFRSVEHRSRMSFEMLDHILKAFLPDRKLKRILLIMAHSDDAEIWCGGTIIKHCLLGSQVTTLVLTSTKEREREALQAAALLPRYSVTCLHNEEFSKWDNRKTIEIVTQHIHSIKPDVIITHQPNDFHPDHRRCSDVVISSLLKLRHINYPDKVYFCNTYFELDKSSSRFSADTYLDITEVESTKHELIRQFKSQKIDYYIEMVKAIDSLNGIRAGVRKAEAFESASFHLANKARNHF